MRQAALVLSLGTAQLLAWGTSYYAIAVIGQPLRADLGLSEPELFGAFAWSLVLSGLLAPWAGRLLDNLGGRVVLAASGVIGACGFGLLGAASSRIELYASWSLLGLAMTLGLYDTCFAALAQIAPASYRKNVTAVSLVAGFASTVAWPVSHYLLREVGWRRTCLAYAAVQLACALLYIIVLPTAKPRTDAAERVERTDHTSHTAKLLALAFAGTAFVGSAFSAHLIQILTSLQVDSERAVWLASSVGVMQVAGRLVESLFARRHSAMHLGFVTFGALAASTTMLLGIRALPWLVIPFVMLYGVANGLTTIVKAAIPVELFGFAGVGARLGAFSAPALVTRAAAPFAFALLTSSAGLTWSLAVIALVGAGSFWAFSRVAHTPNR